MFSSSSRFTQKMHALVSVVILSSLALSLCAPLVTSAQVNFVTPRPPVESQLTPSANGTAETAAEKDMDVEWDCEPQNGDFQGCFTFLFYNVMLWTKAIARSSGQLLDTVILKLVIQMSQIIGGGVSETGTAGHAIQGMWALLRDVANVFLVFITIFIGLSTIVGATGYGYKRMLFKVVLATLFVNFSITLARVVIDTSNIVALGIYESLQDGRCMTEAEYVNTTNGTAGPCLDAGITARFADELRIQQLLGPGSMFPGASEGGEYDFDTWFATTEQEGLHKRIQWVSVLGIFMFLTMAFVFAIAAALIFVRFFVLTMLIVLSPIGLVAWITGISGSGKKWWDELLRQSFFLPAMFLMWLLALQMLGGMRRAFFDGDDPDVVANAVAAVGGMGTQSVSYFGVFIYFAFVMGLLLFSLSLAKRMGAVGADVVIKTGGAMAGWATVGMAARVGRNTLGRLASNEARNDELMRQSVEGNWAQRKIAAGRLKMHDKIASSSFDARALAGKDAQKWIGEGKKGGYTQKTKDEQKRIEEVHKRLGEAKTTGEEKYARDKKLDTVEEDHKTLAKVGEGGTEWERKKARAVVDRLKQEAEDASKKRDALSGQDEVNRAQKALDAVPNEKQLEAMEKKHSELKSEAFMPGADAKKMQAYEDSRKALESARSAASQRDTLKEDLKQAESKAETMKQSDAYKKALEEANVANNSFDSANKHYTASEELKRLKESGASGEEIQNQRAKLEETRLALDKTRSQRGAAVDAEYMSKAKDRATARQEAFLNNESNRLFGRKHREFTTTLRKKTGKAARNEEMEKLFKKWKEEEEGTTPSVPSSTTPTAPTATTTT